jgi:diguanylate cyclase (GGDEF)-like protein
LCQDYFQYARTYQSRNETEYNSIVDILRQAIMKLSAGTSFHSDLLGSAQRFRELVRLDDIEVLRKRIVQEVHDLERAIEEKKRESEQFVELLSSRLEFIENKLCDTQLRLKKTETETSVDALTGIGNRRYFDRQLDMWVAERSIGPFVLAMIDVDNFKKVNDQYGHQTGDRVLIDVARIMRKSIRNDDVFARYGGEEFTILFANMSLEQAEESSLRILESIRSTRFTSTNGTPLAITLSCGLAACVRGDTARTLLERADDALYAAKQHGRDRVETRRLRQVPIFGGPVGDGKKGS